MVCMLDFGGSCEDYLHLGEFSHNNSYQESIKKWHRSRHFMGGSADCQYFVIISRRENYMGLR